MDEMSKRRMVNSGEAEPGKQIGKDSSKARRACFADIRKVDFVRSVQGESGISSLTGAPCPQCVWMR